MQIDGLHSGDSRRGLAVRGDARGAIFRVSLPISLARDGVPWKFGLFGTTAFVSGRAARREILIHPLRRLIHCHVPGYFGNTDSNRDPIGM